jgi:predicted TIM-barrel fold metal-dependent hydrolase
MENGMKPQSLARDFPNVYLELCAVMDERNGILEKFVEKAGPQKILFGTDMPWFNYHYYIGVVLVAEIS